MRRVSSLVLVVSLGACAATPAPPANLSPPPVASSTAAPPPTPAPPPEPTPDLALLRAFAQTRGFHLGTPAHATVTADGSAVLFLRSAARDPSQSLYEMNVATGDVRLLASPDSLHAGPETLSPEERMRRERMRVRTTGFTSLELTRDGTRALVSLGGRLFVVDRATARGRELPTGPGAAIDPHFSPDGSRVAYVRDDDLYAISVADGHETRVTRGGSERLTHGLAEFIAQEELDRSRGFWWSPDGAHILYEEADTAGVDVLSIADPLHPDQAPQRIAYPRPGRPNAIVRFGIVASAGGATTWIPWDRSRLPYVAHASWPEGGPPLLYALDRLQQRGELLAVDATTGKTRTLLEERDAAWVNVDPSVPRWLPDGSGFLWSTERSGEWQLELRAPSGALVRTLLPAGSGYEAVADVDEKTRAAVVVASDDPTQSATWLVPLDAGGSPRRLGGEAPGVVAAAFGRAHDRYVSAETSLGGRPRWVVRSLDGAVAREIPAATEWPAAWPAVEMTEVGADRVRVAIVRPRDFRPGRRYPVVDAAYAGPGHNVVEQSALAFVRAQWIADAAQAVVVAIDGRGTPRRGRDWERAIFRKLGRVPLEDHVAAVQALTLKYREMDASRVGVFGWSFGGYFSALAVLARPDVYKAAVAGAPPADWRDYDTAYTERYLGLPDDDAAGYDDASLLTAARRPASGPPRPLLLVHGTADDNVWFLNTVKLTDALERAGRPFDLLPLAGTTHMLLDPDLSEAVWLRTARALRDALGPPS